MRLLEPRSLGAIWAAATCLFVSFAPAHSSETAADSEELLVKPGEDGFISSWLQLGPIPKPKELKKNTDALSDRDPLSIENLKNPPREGDANAGFRWKAAFGRSRYLEFDGTRPAVAYLAAVVRTSREQKLWLSVGSDEGVEIWLNAKRLFKRFSKRTAKPDNDLVPLDLKSGQNLLVLKTLRSENGPWRVFARLMDDSFAPPKDAEFVLQGALKRFAFAFERMGRLSIERKADLGALRMRVDVGIAFPGGRPIAGQTSSKVSFCGTVRPDASEGSVDLSSAAASDLDLGSFVFEGEQAPSAVRVEVAGLDIKESLGFRMRDLAGLSRAYADLKTAGKNDAVPRTSRDSAAWRVEHLKALIENGDGDYKYLSREIEDTVAITGTLAQGRDPYQGRKGEVQRRGYLSALDGSYQYYALYVPPQWREDGEKRFGLVVSLHGLNGSAMNNMAAVFGETRDESETKLERERDPGKIGPAPFFVVSPSGFGNSGYRAFGEVDVLEAIERVRERYRIDPDRIYITGLSMGGIGSASIPLHMPDLFAAAAPLCGYHDLFLYRSLKAAKLKPWERFLAEFRSNKNWALNGRHLPLYVVHGLKDSPANSDGLVESYKMLGYDVTYEKPDVGHNVWDQTYENGRIFAHFAKYKRAAHPRKVSFTTASLRYGSSYWIRIDDVIDAAKWSKVDASWGENNEIKIEAENIAALTVRNDEVLRSGGKASLSIGGSAFELDLAAVEWRFHLQGEVWAQGEKSECTGFCKRPELSGPLSDAFFEPLLFVYGTGDPGEEALARRIIDEIKEPLDGITIDWPVKADAEVTDEDLERHSLVLVGTAKNHRLLSRIADKLPIRAGDGAVEAGKEKFKGEAVAASFIHPNPLNPRRYVVVHTGASTQALYYVAHLPELLPDYIIYDASAWSVKGGRVLGDERDALKAGFFDRNWGL